MKKLLLFSLLAVAFVGSALEAGRGYYRGNCSSCSTCSTGSCKRGSCATCETPCETGACPVTSVEEDVTYTSEQPATIYRNGNGNGSSAMIATTVEEQV